MVNFGKIYKGNLGTDFQMLVQTTNNLGTINTVTDLSTTVSITITLTNPNGVATTYSASAMSPPGTDGIAHFITSLTTSIWTMGGYWTARATCTFNDGTVTNTQDVSFPVLP